MRKLWSLLSLTLTAALLFPSICLAAGTFSYNDAADARRKALEAFWVCAFSAEYEEGADRGFLVRWEEPIRVFASGNPSRGDLNELNSFLTELSLRVPLLPAIYRVGSESQANVVIHYCKLREMPGLIPSYVSGNWGFCNFRYTNCRINQAVIAIAIDKCDRKARNHLMREELVGALGLCNDHELYKDSIIYQPWTTVQTLSEVDWIMLNFLYSPWVKPGDDWPTAQRALRQHYGL